MVRWFWQRDKAPRRTLVLRSRGDSGDATRVDFAELAPELNTFLGQDVDARQRMANEFARSLVSSILEAF